MRKLLPLVLLLAIGGCAHYVPRGVDVTITQETHVWNACSINVWHTYGDYGGESEVLHFIDDNKQTHEISGQYRVDYSKIVCY